MIITGTAGDETLLGTADADEIDGLAGDDTLEGAGGDDRLDGDSGNDLLIGGAGDDRFADESGINVFDGGDGNDIFKFEGSSANTASGGAGQDKFELEVPASIAHQSHVVTDFVTGPGGDVLDVEPLILDSSLHGFAGGNPFDPALGFLRTLQSGGDTLLQWDRDGSAGGTYDWITMVTLQGVNQADFVNANLDGATILGGGGDDTLPGSGDDDTLAGGAGNDSISGGEGNDSLSGDDGDDTVHGGGGDDTVVSGTGNDSIFADGGDDWVHGNAGDDTIRGSLGNDDLRGGKGNDDLYAGQGEDTLWGALGDDELRGGLDADLLTSGQGDDTLSAGQGDDVLQGRLGNDLLTGGAGNDIFWFNAAGTSNADIIADFGTGEDRIELDSSLLVSLAGMAGGSPAAGNFLAGVGPVPENSNQLLLYDTSTGDFYYDPDGSGAAAAELIVTLSGAPALTVDDIFVS